MNLVEALSFRHGMISVSGDSRQFIHSSLMFTQATTSSLIPSIEESETRNPEAVESIEMIKRHASLAEILLTLGHPRISIHRPYLAHLL